jgi:hypothetical protein
MSVLDYAIDRGVVEMARIRLTTEERFWQKVIVPEGVSDCWLWRGAISKGGYGNFHVTAGKWAVAHRVSYEMHKGPVPEGLDLDHLCRVRHCVNPDHVEAVTRQVNLLRGIGGRLAGERQRSKTHCKQGHEFTTENTAIGKRGTPKEQRLCRICQRIASKKTKEKRKWG